MCKRSCYSGCGDYHDGARCIDVITQLAAKYPEFIVGAGTVLDVETAKQCLDAGARFMTSPGLVPEVVEFTLKHDVVIIPGALTPSKVIVAWKAGVDFVKIFPCAPVGGEQVYLGFESSVASGSDDSVWRRESGDRVQFILAGASALGIGTELLPTEALQRRQESWIHELARRFTLMVRDARTQMHVNAG